MKWKQKTKLLSKCADKVCGSCFRDFYHAIFTYEKDMND